MCNSFKDLDKFNFDHILTFFTKIFVGRYLSLVVSLWSGIDKSITYHVSIISFILVDIERDVSTPD